MIRDETRLHDVVVMLESCILSVLDLDCWSRAAARSEACIVYRVQLSPTAQQGGMTDSAFSNNDVACAPRLSCAVQRLCFENLFQRNRAADRARGLDTVILDRMPPAIYRCTIVSMLSTTQYR
jgi:hypothetical protein